MNNLLFSVTANDCEWQYVRGSGKGGQKRNKTSSKVRCVHPPSNAVGVDDTTRSQHQNKRNAFMKMIETKEFRAWHKMECSRRMGLLDQVEKTVDRAMQPHNVKVEVKQDGKWTGESEQCIKKI
jgi:peptide chain release factor 1